MFRRRVFLAVIIWAVIFTAAGVALAAVSQVDRLYACVGENGRVTKLGAYGSDQCVKRGGQVVSWHVDAEPAVTTATTAPGATTSTTGPDVTTTTQAPAEGLIFDDEFDGTSLDLSKWQPNWLGPNDAAITKPINGAETACYDPAQVSVSGGFLHLDAKISACTDNQGNDYLYRSGLVNTRGDFTFTFGTASARVCTQAEGTQIADWPAFWTDGTGTWPTTGENDIMEGLSGRASAHYHSSGADAGVSAPPALAGPGCHIYSSTWRADKITYAYDGTTIGSVSSGVMMGAIAKAPHFLVLNLAISPPNHWGGPMVLPASMSVDWVRVTT